MSPTVRVRKSVCIVIPSLRGGGAEFVAREWGRWLRGEDHDVTFMVTCTPENLGPLPDGCQVHYLRGNNLILHAGSLRRYLRRNSVDYVVGLLPYFNIISVLATRSLSKRPSVFISGRNVEVPFPEVHGSKVRTTRILSRILYPRADAFLAISHSVAAEAAALYCLKSERIWLIPNPAMGKVSVAQGLATREAIKAGPSEHLDIVVPARIVAQKRPLIPVQSARILLTNDYFKTVHVHYFGAGDMQREVETCAKDLEINVTMHGWHENWYELCGASSVVLLASNAEGFGNVLIEATAVGIPVVASSRALGVSDAIIPGVTGILISADDAESFAVAIWSASEIEVGDVSRWLARFSPQSSGEHLLHALEKTAGARPRIGGGGGV